MRIVDADQTLRGSPSAEAADEVSGDAETQASPALRPAVLADPAQRRRRAVVQAALFGDDGVEAPTIGRFRILSRLGEGGMGVVYAAYDEQLDRKVAVKLLRGAWIHNSEGRARAIREARALARLSHPNVVHVYEVGEAAGEVFVAMEFLTGPTLRAWLEEARRSWPEVVGMFRQAAEGLAAAHRHGVTHRDFKPANAMLGADGRLRVVDFGLAHVADAEASEIPQPMDPPGNFAHGGPALVTQTGALLGTPAYMAAEQFEGRRGDAQTDQFSLCVALYEALYGVRPFEGESLHALITAVTEGRVRPPPSGNNVPAWLHRIVMRGLQPDPAARWPSMAALVGELARDRRAALRRGIAGGAAVLALVALGLGAQQVIEKRATATAERERAERAQMEADEARERSERAAFERTALAEAARSAEVLRLATVDGRERDALVLGVQVLAPFGPRYEDAPLAAVEGLARALPAMLPAATLPPPARPVKSLQLSEDGALLLLALGDGREIQVWTTTPPALQRTIMLGAGEELARVSRGGRLIVASDGASCSVYDVAAGALVRTIAQCSRPDFSVDLRFLLGGAPVPRDPRTASETPDQLKAWTLADGSLAWQSPPTPDHIDFIVHPDGERVVVARAEESVPRILAIATGVEQKIEWRGAPERPGKYTTLFSWLPVVSPDGRQVVLRISDGGESPPDLPMPWLTWPGRIAIFDLESHAAQVIPTAGTAFVGFSRDGQSLLETRHVRINQAWSRETVVYGIDRRHETGGPLWTKKRMSAWSVLGMTAVDALLVDFAEPNLYSLVEGSLLRQSIALPAKGGHQAFSPESDLFALVSPGNRPVLWRSYDPSEVERWTAPPGERIIAHDEGFVVTSDRGGALRLHDRFSQRPPLLLASAPGKVSDLSHSGSGLWLHGEEAKRPSTQYLDAATGTEVFRHVHTGALADGRSGVHSRRAPLFAALPGDGGIAITDVTTSTPVCNIPGDGTQIERLTFADDGRWLAFVRASRVLSIWSMGACSEVFARRVPWSANFDAAGDRWLTIRADEVTLVLDAASGTVELEVANDCPEEMLPGPPRMSPDGRILLTSCSSPDSAVGRVWDVEDGSLLSTLDDHRVAHAQFVTDDGHIATNWMRKWTFFDARTGAEGFQLHPRAPTREHRAHDDGQHVDIQDRFGDVIRTYPTTRAGLFVAACRALAGTEVADEVVAECRTSGAAS